MGGGDIRRVGGLGKAICFVRLAGKGVPPKGREVMGVGGCEEEGGKMERWEGGRPDREREGKNRELRRIELPYFLCSFFLVRDACLLPLLDYAHTPRTVTATRPPPSRGRPHAPPPCRQRCSHTPSPPPPPAPHWHPSASPSPSP